VALALVMALTMRPASLSSGIDKDRADYTVFCGEWNIGRIYEVRGSPEHLRWFWALHFPSKPESLRTDNRVATLEAAKAEFEASWHRSRNEPDAPPSSGSAGAFRQMSCFEVSSGQTCGRSGSRGRV
jgi:hypothetical protein